MKLLSLLFLLSLSTAHTPSMAADDVRALGEKDMADLAGRIGKDLKKCKELKHGAEVELSFMNATSEFIDKDAFGKLITSQLPPAPPTPGRKYDLAVKLSSTAEEKNHQYEGRYTLTAQLKQGDEVLCMKSEKLVKKGKVGQ